MEKTTFRDTNDFSCTNLCPCHICPNKCSSNANRHIACTKGDKGDTGPAGPAGPAGAKGDKGDTGTSTSGIDTIMITGIPIEILSTQYQIISYFPWIDAERGLYTGTIVFDTSINNNSFDIQVIDVINNTSLGGYYNVITSGIYGFNFENPQQSSRLAIELKKNTTNAINPVIYSIILKYNGRSN